MDSQSFQYNHASLPTSAVDHGTRLWPFIGPSSNSLRFILMSCLQAHLLANKSQFLFLWNKCGFVLFTQVKAALSILSYLLWALGIPFWFIYRQNSLIDKTTPLPSSRKFLLLIVQHYSILSIGIPGIKEGYLVLAASCQPFLLPAGDPSTPVVHVSNTDL